MGQYQVPPIRRRCGNLDREEKFLESGSVSHKHQNFARRIQRRPPADFEPVENNAAGPSAHYETYFETEKVPHVFPPKFSTTQSPKTFPLKLSKRRLEDVECLSWGLNARSLSR